MNYTAVQKLGYALSLTAEGNEPELADNPTGVGDPCLLFSVYSNETQKRARSEIADYDRIEFGVLCSISFNLFIPTEYQADRDRDIVHQWHGTPDDFDNTGDVPLLISLDSSDRLSVVTSHIPESVGGDKGCQTIHYSEPIVRNRWLNVEYDIMFNFDSSGIFKLRLNDAEIIDFTGPIGFNDAVGPYVKWGLYHWMRPGETRSNKSVYINGISKR